MDTTDDVADALASIVMTAQKSSLSARQTFNIAVSGGSLPKILGLGLRRVSSEVDGQKWRIFFVDERCVKLTHDDSNYHAVDVELLRHLAIPETNVWPPPPALTPPQVFTVDTSLDADAAAASYERTIVKQLDVAEGLRPAFDLVLLGVGEDGHTASLFPSHPLLKETSRHVAAVKDSPKPPPERVTLTLPVINSARDVVIVAVGGGKADILHRVFEGDRGEAPLPIEKIRTAIGAATWLVDRAAAEKLVKTHF